MAIDRSSAVPGLDPLHDPPARTSHPAVPTTHHEIVDCIRNLEHSTAAAAQSPRFVRCPPPLRFSRLSSCMCVCVREIREILALRKYQQNTTEHRKSQQKESKPKQKKGVENPTHFLYRFLLVNFKLSAIVSAKNIRMKEQPSKDVCLCLFS